MKYYPIGLSVSNFFDCAIPGGASLYRCSGCRSSLLAFNYDGLRCNVGKSQLRMLEKSESRRPLFLRASSILAIAEVGVRWLMGREVSGVVFHPLPIVGSSLRYFTLEVVGSYECEILDLDGAQVCQLCNSFFPSERKAKFGAIINSEGSDFVFNQRYNGRTYVKDKLIANMMLDFPDAFELKGLAIIRAMDDGLECSDSDLIV